MLSEDWLKYIPQQWVGILALVMFFATLTTHLIEKYPLIAKILPAGKWWHNRVKRKRRNSEYIAEDNEVIANLSNQVELLAKDMREMRDDLRCLRAWSVYDARWHHQAEVASAETDYSLPRHYDYFEFERIWRNDPLAAARLSFLEETLEGPK
ncbi:MAG: hypothetical protein HYX31_23715 [Mycobacterium sp.]|nr:hypothetical protein [Mycobacterium sp.]